MDRNYDVITFISNYFHFKKTNSSQFFCHYQNCNYVYYKKVKRMKNYVLKCKFYLYFKVKQKLLVSHEIVLISVDFEGHAT